MALARSNIIQQREPRISSSEGYIPVSNIEIIRMHKTYIDGFTNLKCKIKGIIQLQDNSLCPYVIKENECHVLRRFVIDAYGQLRTEWLGVGVFDLCNFSTIRDAIRSFNAIREKAAVEYVSMSYTFRCRKIINMEVF